MMPPTYTEVILSSTLLTTNQYFDSDRKAGDSDRRVSYLFSTLQITHGISSSGRVNVGIDMNYRVGRSDIDRNSSPLDVLSSSGEGMIDYERAFTSIGIRARYVPLADHPNFVIQNTFTIPVSTSSYGSLFLGDNRSKLNTQLLYNHLVGRKMFIFGQADVLVLFKTSHYNAHYAVPLNIYASYLATRNIIPFALIGTSNSWDDSFSQQAQAFTYGLGLQIQFTTMFTANLFYNDTFAGKNVSQWQAFNVGVRGVF
jgi:hypothetical protein